MTNDFFVTKSNEQCIPPPRPSYQCRDPDPDLDPYPDPWSGSSPKLSHLFSGPLSTIPENFVQIRSEVFAQSC